MISSWRWFGDRDPVTLKQVEQTGVRDVVSSLHHLPCGTLWTLDQIKEYQQKIRLGSGNPKTNGMEWSIVESVPVHESIKKGEKGSEIYIKNYQETIRNLGACDIKVLVYNFMPVLDWTRTHLQAEFRGVKTLFFSETHLACFDLFVIKRSTAKLSYSQSVIESATHLWESLSFKDRKQLEQAILMGLPGTVDDLSPDEFLQMLNSYAAIGHEEYFKRCISFLEQVIPVAEEAGVYMAIHPDDPPKSIFGLPRITHKREDIRRLLNAIPSPHHGLTFCTGSLGALGASDLKEWLMEFASRTYFLHLRNVKFENDDKTDFSEAGHLSGDVNMIDILSTALKEEKRRKNTAHPLPELYYRSDHGVLYDFDSITNAYAGYWPVGRFAGLCELRGAIKGLQHLN